MESLLSAYGGGVDEVEEAAEAVEKAEALEASAARQKGSGGGRTVAVPLGLDVAAVRAASAVGGDYLALPTGPAAGAKRSSLAAALPAPRHAKRKRGTPPSAAAQAPSEEERKAGEELRREEEQEGEREREEGEGEGRAESEEEALVGPHAARVEACGVDVGQVASSVAAVAPVADALPCAADLYNIADPYATEQYYAAQEALAAAHYADHSSVATVPAHERRGMVEIVEVNQNELVGSDEWKAGYDPGQSRAISAAMIAQMSTSRMQKQRNQMTALMANAKARDVVVQQRAQRMRETKAEVRTKYGW